MVGSIRVVLVGGGRTCGASVRGLMPVAMDMASCELAWSGAGLPAAVGSLGVVSPQSTWHWLGTQVWVPPTVEAPTQTRGLMSG